VHYQRLKAANGQQLQLQLLGTAIKCAKLLWLTETQEEGLLKLLQLLQWPTVTAVLHIVLGSSVHTATVTSQSAAHQDQPRQ